MGADDYLPKPFERRELVARVKGDLEARGSRFRVDGLIVDLSRRAVLDAQDAALSLTSGEFELLRCFVDRPGRVLSRDQLIECRSKAARL